MHGGVRHRRHQLFPVQLPISDMPLLLASNQVYLLLKLNFLNKNSFRTNENGLCPACRQSYPEDPVNFQPLSSAELQKIKTEKKQKVQQQKNKLIESRKHLSEFRVLQKNLVYAVGLSQRMADPELLKK